MTRPKVDFFKPWRSGFGNTGCAALLNPERQRVGVLPPIFRATASASDRSSVHTLDTRWPRTIGAILSIFKHALQPHASSPCLKG
jgi:hypothetical protein